MNQIDPNRYGQLRPQRRQAPTAVFPNLPATEFPKNARHDVRVSELVGRSRTTICANHKRAKFALRRIENDKTEAAQRPTCLIRN